MTTATMQRTSFPQGHSYKSSTSSRKPNNTGNDSKGIWLSMLDDVSRGSNLAEKQLIILGENLHQADTRSFIPLANHSMNY